MGARAHSAADHDRRNWNRAAKSTMGPMRTLAPGQDTLTCPLKKADVATAYATEPPEAQQKQNTK